MFKPYEAIPAKKVACRPSSWFKLGYVENSVDQEKKDFGMKTEEKVTNCFNNIHYAVWNIYRLYMYNYMYYRESQIF